MQITIWCQNIDSDFLAHLFIEHVRDAGFTIKEKFRIHQEKDEFIKAAIQAGYLRESKPYEGRDAIKVGNQKISYGSSAMIEFHEQIYISCRKSTKRAFDKFNKLFMLLINEKSMNIREICFSMENMENYPYFTFKRFSPRAPIVMVDVPTGSEITHKDDNYWLELSPRLHFISSALLEESNIVASDWAKHIKAKVCEYSCGVVFDCGWSALGINLKYAG